MRGPRQLRVVALTAFALAGVIAAAPAVFAAIPKVDVAIDSACVAGPWAQGTPVDFTLMTSTGSLRQEKSVTATVDGIAAVCFDVAMAVGDRVRISQGLDDRTLTVPRLAITAVNRAPDVVKVRTKARTSTRLSIHRCGFSMGFTLETCPTKASVSRRSGSTGKVTIDTTSTIDLRGFDIVEATIKNAAGDRFHDSAYVPYFFVNPGSSGISGFFGPRAVTEFQLLNHPGGSVIGTVALPSNAPFGDFNNGSANVPVKAGNQVVGDFSKDGRMTVPPLVTKVDVASDEITAKCFAGRQYQIITVSPSGGPWRGLAGAKGLIKRTANVNLTPSSFVSIQCLSATGDGVSETFDVN